MGQKPNNSVGSLIKTWKRKWSAIRWGEMAHETLQFLPSLLLVLIVMAMIYFVMH